MERVCEPKSLPRQLPTLSEVVGNSHLNFGTGEDNLTNGRKAHNSNKYFLVRTWKGKNYVEELDELMPDVASLKNSADSFEDVGSTLFHGASHPPESVDTDLMNQVCFPLGQNKGDANSLVKSLSVKGPFIENLSIGAPGTKPSMSLLSPTESLVEEPINLAAVSSPFIGLRPSLITEASLPPDSEEKECTWDASVPPSGNVSPHSNIDSSSVGTSMSIVNSCTSTYMSDGRMSDGMLSIGNYESTKASFRGESLESVKTSLDSDSSGVSDDSNWSNMTGSESKLHKGNDPRWKAIHAIRTRDGIFGMSHFRLLKRLGCGDIGSVYLSEMSGTRCYFAMEVMDKASLASRKKIDKGPDGARNPTTSRSSIFAFSILGF